MNAVQFDSTLVLAGPGDEGAELTIEEHRECHSLPKHLRANWRAGRIAAKRAVAGALNLEDPARVVIGADPSGAPRVSLMTDGRVEPAQVFLSIAHRDGKGAAMAHPSSPVGVDIERAGMVAPGAERFFLSREEQIASPLCASSLWTLKEAAWKALECHGSTPFSALRLCFDGAGRVDGVELFGFRYRAAAEVLRPWPEFLLGCIALESLVP